MDWSAWHDRYDVADSPMARRLQAVQGQIRAALSEAPAGEIKVVSLCAGDGRDLLEILADHPRRDDVRARLVELDPRNTAAARERADRAGLRQVEIVTGDASLIDHYQDVAPADLVLVCGVFGNVADPHIERIITACTQLCSTGGTVIWTRHRRAPDRIPRICDWFAARGFELQWLSPVEAGFGVGVHRFAGTPHLLRSGMRMFEFVGYDVLRQSEAAYVETARMTLRRFTEADADDLAALHGHPEVMRHIDDGHPVPRAVVVREQLPRILREYDELPSGQGCLLAAEKSSGRFLGWLSLRPAASVGLDGGTELGYRMLPSVWGRGYATEGARALVRHAFTELDVELIVATTMTVNTASRRVMEKAGLSLVRTFVEEWPKYIEGAEHGDVEYAITRESYRQRAGLLG